MDFLYRRSYRGSVKAVILDWAGTAVDYGSFAPTMVFLRLFEHQGVTITSEEARSGMGLMKKDHLRTILKLDRVAKAWQEVHGKPSSEADVDNLFNNFVPMQTTVLVDYADPIPGLLHVVEDLHQQGIKIGSTTGYIHSMMDILAPEAAKHGYEPDCIVSSDDVPAGRPYPWMSYQNAMQMGVYPLEAIVKVGDTIPDIEEGLNADMWTVGLSMTGSLLGMDQSGADELTEDQRQTCRKEISSKLYRAGAHYVIDGIWDLPIVLEKIKQRLDSGEKP